jgi:hypothetical protein
MVAVLGGPAVPGFWLLCLCVCTSCAWAWVAWVRCWGGWNWYMYAADVFTEVLFSASATCAGIGVGVGARVGVTPEPEGVVPTRTGWPASQ